jgi:hypothetical protein
VLSLRFPPLRPKAILDAVSDWLKLLALIVLAAESLLAAAYRYGDQNDPFRRNYFPLMIGLLVLIVLALVLDRVLASKVLLSQSQMAGGKPEQMTLITRWYFNSGVTEEELALMITGHRVTGRRKTRHPKGKETVYDVTGWHHTSAYWLEYHDALGQFGGGSILLDEFTNDRFSGLVVSKDCATGVLQCRANMWVPLRDRKSHSQRHFIFVGKIAPEGFSDLTTSPPRSAGS